MQVSVLTLLIVLPAATALILLTCDTASRALGGGKLSELVWRAGSAMGAVATLGIAGYTMFHFEAKQTAFQFVDHRPWLPELGVDYFVGLDGLSVLLALVTALVALVAIVSAVKDRAHSLRSALASILFIESGVLGALASLNLLLFYVFWELSFLFGIALVAANKDLGRSVANSLLAYSLTSSFLFLTGLIFLGGMIDPGTSSSDFNWISPDGASEGLRSLDLGNHRLQQLTVAAFVGSLGLKLPVIPFHVWVGRLHGSSDPSSAIIFVSVLLKLSAFALLRFLLPLFPGSMVALAPWGLSLALVTSFYAVIVASVQVQWMRAIALLSLAHFSLFLFGVFTLNVEGFEGATLHLVNHCFLVAALTLLAGMLRERRGTDELRALGGVAKTMPAFSVLLLLTAAGWIGLPGSGGFVAEFLIFLGMVRESPSFAGLALLAVVVVGIVLIRTCSRILFGRVDPPESPRLVDLSLREKLLVVALLVPVFWAGWHPETFLRRIHPAVLELCAVVEGKLDSPSGKPVGTGWRGCQ